MSGLTACALQCPFARSFILPRAAGSAVVSVAKQLTGVDPVVAALLAGVGLGLPSLAAWNAAYGGYAGVLQPEEAFEALQVRVQGCTQGADAAAALKPATTRGKGRDSQCMLLFRDPLVAADLPCPLLLLFPGPGKTPLPVS